MNDILYIADFVVSAVLNVWPAFAISIILSVLVHALKLDGAIRRAFQANVALAIILATLVGAFSPFCSCTVVPIIAGLLASGVPLAPVMAFWIASPTMDPEIFALSVGILGWPLALARLLATLTLSIGAGYITLALTQRIALVSEEKGKKSKPSTASSQLLTPASSIPVMAAAEFSPPAMSLTTAAVATAPVAVAIQPGTASCSSGSCQIPKAAKQTSWQSQLAQSFRGISWPEFGRDVLKLSWSLGRWLLLAFILEALISRYIPQASIAAILGENNWFAVPLAALIGIPLYLNNLAALPIVSGLLAQGMQSGAAIAFLIAGPVTTIPAMTAVWGVVSRRVFALYLGLSLGGAVLFGFVVNFLGF
jgi:uncharacterized membrane protein YraQ (UPF0718 family)